jgi:hypothetical protein
MAAISSRSALESERVERPRIFWTNLPRRRYCRVDDGLRTGRKAAGQRLLFRRQRAEDLILGDVLVLGQGGSRTEGNCGAERRNRDDCGKGLRC